MKSLNALAFYAGCILLFMVLLIVAFSEDTTPTQYNIYRIMIAIAGAGFTIALTGALMVRITFFGKGMVRATGAFGIFVILYFFSPAVLPVDTGKMEAIRLVDSYNQEDSAIANAREVMQETWMRVNKNKLIETTGETPNQQSLEKLRDAFRDEFRSMEVAKAFDTVAEFHVRVFDCVASGSCDRATTCREFLKEILGFRGLYCDRLIERTDGVWPGLWDQYSQFTEQSCKSEFLSHYINYEDVSDLKAVCIPIQCWARNTAPPYPCHTRQQVVGGIMVPM